MTFAMVKVLPEPVTPFRVWNRRFSLTPWVSREIARPWSPAGENGETTSSLGTDGLLLCPGTGAGTSFTRQRAGLAAAHDLHGGDLSGLRAFQGVVQVRD